MRQYTFDAVSDLDENFIHIENTQAAVRKVVKAERRVELCLENNRWYDLRRWKDAELEESVPVLWLLYFYD